MQESFKIPSATFPTLTGSIVTFNSQYAGLPLKSHKIALTATQSGSGTPSPDNVRPISGCNAINISQSGADTSNPTVHTIQIGSKVYGGEYDARTGVLTVTHKLVDMGSLLWQYSNAYGNNLFYTNSISDMAEIAMLASSQYKYAGIITSSTEWSSIVDETIVKWRGASRVYLVDSNYTNVSSFTQMLIENNAQLLYELETPFTIQLPPCPIDTLEGVNNIWADTGDTTLQYPKFG
jgi:hypothetical protein